MKKASRILVLALAAAVICLCLTSCATKLDGTYALAADTKIAGIPVSGSLSCTFDGDKYSIKIEGAIAMLAGSLGNLSDGTYEITDNDDGTQSIVLTQTVSGTETKQTLPFSQDKDADTITISGITLVKQK